MGDGVKTAKKVTTLLQATSHIVQDPLDCEAVARTSTTSFRRTTSLTSLPDPHGGLKRWEIGQQGLMETTQRGIPWCVLVRSIERQQGCR